jgi:thermostable 8-oxoguanine DNA glycosylase
MPKSDEHYIFTIEKYLKSRGALYPSNRVQLIKERLNGKHFTKTEHIKALVYSQLSLQRKWSFIEPHFAEIDEIFLHYDSQKLKEYPTEKLVNGLKAIKCGNRSVNKWTKALPYNIEIFEKMERNYGSIDAFITSDLPQNIVKSLSSYGSEYKIKVLGVALAWEYLRYVGIDGAKPDTHLMRFLGRERMGHSKGTIATISEVAKQVSSLSKETGLYMVEIDNIIWCFCADGYGEVCTAEPNCDICPVMKQCKNK